MFAYAFAYLRCIGAEKSEVPPGFSYVVVPSRVELLEGVRTSQEKVQSGQRRTLLSMHECMHRWLDLDFIC